MNRHHAAEMHDKEFVMVCLINMTILLSYCYRRLPGNKGAGSLAGKCTYQYILQSAVNSEVTSLNCVKCSEDEYEIYLN